MFQNDVEIIIEFTCKDQDNNALNLTTAIHAYLYMKRGTEVLRREMAIDDERTSGKVSYTITNKDLTQGDMNYSFQVSIDFTDGSHYNGEIVEEHIARPLEADYVETP